MKLSLSEIFDKAADEIEVRGWTRDTLENEKGNICLSKAIFCALNLNGVCNDPDYVLARSLIMNKVGETPPWWNDKIAKDQFEVIDLLRTLAKESRENNG